MTTVRLLDEPIRRWVRVVGTLPWAVAVLGCLVLSSPVLAQGPPAHWHHAGAMPPGAIGSQRLLRGGPLLGHFQPVAVSVPEGALISVANQGAFTSHQPGRILVGLQVSPVYRFRVTSLPLFEDLELYPTVELIGRTYPPPGQQLRFPIPIELTREDLELALEGMFVTRVIYVEDPATAEPIAREADEQPWFEAPDGQDPLVMADQLGRPVAIVRIGGRIPQTSGDNGDFLYGCPPVKLYESPTPVGQMASKAPARLPTPPLLSDTEDEDWPPARADVTDEIPPDLAPFNRP